MASGLVKFLLQNINQLLVYSHHLIYKLEDEVRSLQSELNFIHTILIDSKEILGEHETARLLVRQIIDEGHKGEDLIEKFVVDKAKQKIKSRLEKVVVVTNRPKMLASIDKKIKKITKRVNQIFTKIRLFIEIQGSELFRSGSLQRIDSSVEEVNVVGFDMEARVLIDRLTNGSEKLEVIYVVGMGGLGKTTMARKVYSDPSIIRHFHIRAWICVSHKYEQRELLLCILCYLVPGLTDQISKVSLEWLHDKLKAHLENQNYLFVIDDVWNRDTWDDIRRSFPGNNRGCRILLTSQNTDVALHASGNSPLHQLCFLNDDDSWELLCSKVEGCPFKLEKLGKQIMKQCCGIPLAITVVARHLLKYKTSNWWKKVAKSVESYVATVESYVATEPKDCMDVFAVSCQYLSPETKLCFIYLGGFPLDFKIPIWKLLRLWVAEGFILQKECGQRNLEDLEDIAEDYLEQLAEKNLIIVVKRRKINGQIKTC